MAKGFAQKNAKCEAFYGEALNRYVKMQANQKKTDKELCNKEKIDFCIEKIGRIW